MHTMDQAILIVEHDQPTRDLYRRELSRVYRVFACTDQRDVLDLVQAHTVSAVVLEPDWPDGAGWSLLATLRYTPDTRSIPIILCSALDERRRGLELGAVAYLVKPVLPTTLLEMVQRFTRAAPSTITTGLSGSLDI